MDTTPHPTALDALLALPHGQEVIDWAMTPESGIEMTKAAILYAFKLYADHAYPKTWAIPLNFLVIEDEEEREFCDPGHGWSGDRSYREASSPPEGSLGWTRALLVHVLKVASEIVEGVRPKRPEAPPKEKRHRRTREEIRRDKDAARKRLARAEGRVKPKAPKPVRTRADWIAATEKSLATRLAKLAELKANPKPDLVDIDEVYRTERGIERTRKTLATYQLGWTPLTK